MALHSGPASAATLTATPKAWTKNPASLLDVWLLIPQAGQIDWSYAFIATDRSTYLREHQKAALLAELSRIEQLEPKAPSLVRQVTSWSKAVRAADAFRVPGYWGAAHLLANPSRMPPIKAVSRVGYCETVSWVEIWDKQGVRRIKWRPEMKLPQLAKTGDVDVPWGISWIQIVLPWGDTRRIGIASWNEEDQPIVPGTRIVVPLRIDGYSGEWLNRSLPDFLAHVVTGDECWQAFLEFDSDPENNTDQ